MARPKEKTQNKPQMRRIRGEFIRFDEPGVYQEGRYDGYVLVEVKSGRDVVSVPKYTLQTEDGPVSFLGTTQIVEALSRVPMGTYVSLCWTGEETRTTQGYKVKEFDILMEEGVELLTPVSQKALSRGRNGDQVDVDPNTGEVFTREDLFD